MNGIPPTPRLLIVWHSRTGASEQMAKAAANAAMQELAVDCVPAEAATRDLVLEAAAYLFVCPENLGTMSGAMKEFFDRLYYPVLGKIEGRAYAAMIAAGSDGTGALRQLERIVTGWRLRCVVEPLIVNMAAQTPEEILKPKLVAERELEQCRDIGRALGAGAAMGVF